jgi:hypothetical protein
LPLSNTDDHCAHPYAALASSSNKSDHNEGTRVIDLFNKTVTNFIKLLFHNLHIDRISWCVLIWQKIVDECYMDRDTLLVLNMIYYSDDVCRS